MDRTRPTDRVADASDPSEGSRTEPPELDSRVESAVESYLRACEAGGKVDRQAFLARHAEIAGPLGECLDMLEMIHANVKDLVPTRPPDDLCGSSEGGGPRLLDDYRLLREIGRGGMGVVYEAHQISLGRRVAVKVLPTAAALDPKQIQRFKLEAQAAALLQHPNIVPIHAVGHERGTHYYAMQFIEGPDLATVIRRLSRPDRPGRAAEVLRRPESGPLAGPVGSAETSDLPRTAPDGPPPGPASGPAAMGRSADRTARSLGQDYYRAAAELGARVAEALGHAHQQGVIHRDIKPANILLDRHGIPWVTDFGLARLHDAAGLTGSNDLLGTLAYMSPEQALGGPTPVDHRTDVYSLGVTLYELVALRPAVAGSDRREILRRVVLEEPAPPRKLTPAIPPDLETIILKAIAKAPEERYGSARELADDLRCFIDDRPIRARPPSLGLRALKWTRRHRAIVAAAGIAAVVAVAVLAVATVVVGFERDAARAAYAREADQRRLSDRNLELALNALDEIFVRITERQSVASPEIEKANREVLERALAFYEAFARENGDSRRVNFETARGHLRVGQIRLAFGQHALAEEAVRRSVDRAERLADRDPGDLAARSLLADGLRAQSVLAQSSKEWPEAEALQRRAIALRRSLVSDRPREAEHRRNLAGELINLGIILDDAGREAEAERVEREALAVLDRCATELPGEGATPAFLRHSVVAEFRLGRLYRKVKRDGEAEAALRSSVEEGEALASRPGARNSDRARLADSALEHGIVLARLGRGEEAEAAFRRCVAIREDLARDEPSVLAYRDGLASGYHNLGLQLRRQGQVPAAEKLLTRSLEINQQLVAEVDDVPRHREGVAFSEYNLGVLRRADGRLDEAEGSFRRAVAAWGDLVDRHPSVPEYRHRLATSHHDLGLTLARLDRPDDAAPDLFRARDLRVALVAEHPEVLGYLEALSLGLGELGTFLRDVGRLEEAEAAFRQAVDRSRTLVERKFDLENSKARHAEAMLRLDQLIAFKSQCVNPSSRRRSDGIDGSPSVFESPSRR
jgi:serine/threonine protein kinase/tetratricopeptide (TPR) repeat protein